MCTEDLRLAILYHKAVMLLNDDQTMQTLMKSVTKEMEAEYEQRTISVPAINDARRTPRCES